MASQDPLRNSTLPPDDRFQRALAEVRALRAQAEGGTSTAEIVGRMQERDPGGDLLVDGVPSPGPGQGRFQQALEEVRTLARTSPGPSPLAALMEPPTPAAADVAFPAPRASATGPFVLPAPPATTAAPVGAPVPLRPFSAVVEEIASGRAIPVPQAPVIHPAAEALSVAPTLPGELPLDAIPRPLPPSGIPAPMYNRHELGPATGAARALGRGVGQMVETAGGFTRGLGPYIEQVARPGTIVTDALFPGQAEARREKYEAAGEAIREVGEDIRTSRALRPSPSVAAGGAFQPGNWRWWIERGGEFVPQLATQVAAAATTGGMGTAAQLAAFATPVAVMEAGGAYNEAYDRLIQQGRPPETARQIAAGAAAITGAGAAALERIPGAVILFRRVPGASKVFNEALQRSVLARTGAATAAEGFTEGLQEAWADATEYAATQDPATFQDWQNRYPAATALGALAGAGTSAVLDAAEAAAGSEQRGLALDEPAETLERSERVARQAVDRLRPLVVAGTATPEQQDEYRDALALLRRGEGQSAEEVGLRAEDGEGADEETGDLFGGAAEPAEDAAGLPIAVSRSDIDYEFAVRAHEGASFRPERRAEQTQGSYVAHMRDVYESLAPLAQTDEQKQILAEELERYRDGYLKRIRAVLDARSRTLSSMVTGPAKFPTARNQKRLDTEVRRIQEMGEWSERAQRAMRKRVAPERSRVVSSDDPNAPDVLRKKVAERQAMQERMREGNKVARSKKLDDNAKRARLAEMGFSARLVQQVMEPDYAGRVGFPPYMLQNNRAEIKRLEGRLEGIEAARGDRATETAFDGGTVVDNVEENRLQILFDEKPDADLRKDLKARGFRWAPSQGAWQRMRGAAANQAAESVLGIEIGAQEAGAEPDAKEEAPVVPVPVEPDEDADGAPGVVAEARPAYGADPLAGTKVVDDEGRLAANVRPARLRVTNPFDLNARYPREEVVRLLSSANAATAERIRRGAGLDEVTGESVYNELLRLTDRDKGRVNEILRQAGFDGITHIGGKNTGTAPHRVWITFDRDQIRSAFGPVEAAAMVGEERAEYTPEQMRAQLESTFGSTEAAADVVREIADIAGPLARITLPEGAASVEERAAAVETGKLAFVTVPATGRRIAATDGRLDYKALFRLMRAYRHPGAEYQHVLVVLPDLTGNAEVTHHRMLTVGAIDWALLPSEDVLEAAELAARFGGEVVLVHNHPSGNPDPSPEDRGVTLGVREFVEEAGARFGGHLVINGEFAILIRHDGIRWQEELIHVAADEGTRDWNRPDARRIAGPRHLFDYMAHFPKDAGRVDVLLLNSQHEIIAFEARPVADLDTAAEWLPTLQGETAAVTTVLNTHGTEAYRRALRSIRDLRVLDVLDSESRVSAKEAGDLAGAGVGQRTIDQDQEVIRVFEEGPEYGAGEAGRAGRPGQPPGVRTGREAGRDRAAVPRTEGARAGEGAVAPQPTTEAAITAAEEAKVPGGHPGGFFDLGAAVQGAKGFLKRNFTSAGDLPEPVFRRKVKRDGWVSSQLRQVAFTRRDFETAAREAYGKGELGAEETRAINDVLAGKSAPGTLPSPLPPIVSRMRAELDALSRRMIDSGVVEGPLAAVVDQNMGAYLTRSYRVFDDPDWAEKVPQDVRNKAKALLRSEFEEASDAEIEGMLNELLFRGERDRPVGPVAALASGSKLGSKNLSILQKRKDIAPEIRALWGEYEDPLVNYVRSVQKMAYLIANHEFLRDVRRAHTGETDSAQPDLFAPEAAGEAFLFERPIVRGGVSYHARFAAEGSRTLAPMDGLYTTPEIKRAFEQAVEAQAVPDWLRIYMKANGAAKFSKTVLSLMTHVRNVVGNTSFAVANGHWRAAHAGKAWKATLTNLAKLPSEEWRGYYRRLQELGVVDESARAGELEDVIRDASRKDPREFAESRAERSGRKLLGAVTDLYRAEDDVWKVFAFENEVARYRKALGAPRAEVEERAALIVRNTYPTYSLVPRAVKLIRRFPLVGTFVSFPAEVARTITRTIELTYRELADPKLRRIGAERLAGLMVAAAAVPTMAAASRWLVGMGDDEDDDVRRFLPPWSENSNLLYLSRDDGTVRFVDLSYTDPYSYIRTPLVAFLRGEDWRTAALQAAAEASEPFLGEEMLAEKLLDIARNQKKEGGRVYNPQAPLDAQVEDVVAHVWDAVEPGTVSSVRRIAMGLTGTTTIHGRAYDPALEALAVATGLRLQELDVAQALSFEARRFQREMDDARRVMSGVASRRGAVSDAELEGAYLDMERSRKVLVEAAHQDAVAAYRLGLTEKQVRDVLDGAGLSAGDVRMVLNGVWQPYRPTDRFLAGVTESAEAVASPDEAGEAGRMFEGRRELIREAANRLDPDGASEPRGGRRRRSRLRGRRRVRR